MARQSEKESAEKYALESLKIFIWWLREKGERVEEHIYMDGSKGEQHLKKEIFNFKIVWHSDNWVMTAALSV